MKIFYITDIALDRSTAPTIHIDAICDAFQKLGHEVMLYAPRESFSASYKTILIPAPRTLRSIYYQPQLVMRLIIDIIRKRPDVIYVRHSHLLLAHLVGLFFRIPIYLEVNGILEQDAQHINETLRSRLLLKSGMFALLERINAHTAAKIIAVTDGIADYFVAHYGVPREKIVVAPNGVDTDFFKPDDRASAKRAIGIPGEKKVIGYIGSFHLWQGVAYLLESARILKDSHPEVLFVIVGRGEEKESYVRFIAEHSLTNVDVRDAIAHTDVPRYISAFDACICYPLRFRDGATSPFKIYEYLACARPVIAARLQSFTEEFGDVLIYAEPESAESLSHTIVALLNDPALATRADESRAFVEEGRSWRAVAQKLLALMTHVD